MEVILSERGVLDKINNPTPEINSLGYSVFEKSKISYSTR
jgi:hypothetical protein